MSGRLNVFQRTMLRWCELHPYSGVHAVRVRRRLDQARLEQCIARELESMGLTGLVLDTRRRRFRYAGGPAGVALTVLPSDGDPVEALRSELERQLNLPFSHQTGASPFRFFAVAGPEWFYLGLAYDHFIAGGDSIVLLLKRLAEACAGDCHRPIDAAALRRYPPTYRRLVFRHPGAVLAGLSTLPGLLAASRRCFRARYAGTEDPYNAFTCFRLGSRQLDALRRTGKDWGVTVNDLFLASLMCALSPVAAERGQARRRTQLAVASIVSIRDDFRADVRDTFGQFLASFLVVHPVPDGITLHELARDVHAATTVIKRRKGYLQNIFALGVSSAMWPFLSAARRRRFFAKNYPAWGGVTALNIDGLWQRPVGGAADAPLDYVRAVSTGPVSPLVLAISTAGAALHVGVSFRRDAFSRATIERVSAAFARCIEGLPESAPA